MSSENGDTWRSSKYKHKLTVTNGHLLPDLYRIAENMKSDVKLMPDVSWGDMRNHLVNSPNEYTYGNVKAWKLSNFLCATIVRTFTIMKLQKISILRYQNKGTKIFI